MYKLLLRVNVMNQKGLTLIELLIVIVVVGIISGFTIIQVGNIVENSRISVDSFNLSTLNGVTEKYADSHPSGASDIFDGITDNQARMLALVEAGYLNGIVREQQTGATFEWDIATQRWTLEGGIINNLYGGPTSVYDFSVDTLTQIQDDGVVSPNMSLWSTDDGSLTNTTGETRIFIPVNYNEYSVTVSAALGSGSNGGYGVFFDITLRNGNESRDDGYIFQFDRGYAEGAMIVRPRNNGGEGSPVWTLRADNTSIFPSEAEDPSWWTQTHEVLIVVSNQDETTRLAEFYIDGDYLGSYSYTNEINGEQIYTGFRGWGGSPTTFYSINIGN
jgi:prepilin-type N-terminal cleavage/methylation domain-containing protein